MFLRIECPGCKAVLQVEEALAGKQGKCIHCGHKIIVPTQSGPALSVPVPPPPPVPFLTEATPEAMMRELHERRKSAILLVFEPTLEGSYDLADIPDAKLKCVATEDINMERFAQLVGSFENRFIAKRPAAKPEGGVPGPEPSVIGKLSGPAQGPDEPYELKGDALGMSLADFKSKYARFTPDGRQDLPICSDMPGFIGKADLHGEAWHRKANIIHSRVDNPLEDNSPTVAGVKTDLLLYQFVDGKLFRISALFATDLFHMVNEAVVNKFGPPSRETKQPRELIWDNNVSRIVLTRGTVHPRTASSLHLIHKELLAAAESRMPKASHDI
jgi:hypothetical protein